eukprot:Skav207022  [mRNA]  locus=scaffold2740:235230:237515:+ [translate_table: standard]
MAMCNIPSTNTDPQYRYKMPRLMAKIEGRGNGAKTCIVNMGEVCDQVLWIWVPKPTTPTRRVKANVPLSAEHIKWGPENIARQIHREVRVLRELSPS